ncbi:MAG TPA: hypothetical protein VMH87_16940 [Pseudomonadales bacterium]|nr:hypothetical protein [Pseudomonadales bacterium]
MKITARFVCSIILAAGLALSGCAKKKFNSWSYVKDPAVATQLQSFIAQKEAQANASTKEAMLNYAPFFAAANAGDWPALNQAFIDLQGRARQYQDSGTASERIWGGNRAAVIEIWGALDAFGEGNEKYSALYANDIIQSIPPGSIYFGGTDPGRFLITGMQKSQVAGDPFFTLTQNALADGSYLNYLQSMYGDRIYIPTSEDSQKCFEDYYADVQERMKNHKLDPGEKAFVDPASGKLQVSGEVAVMNINALIVKVIFEHETNRKFYIEESFPLAWMYPYLEPHGLIFKLNHQPLAVLSDEAVQQVHDYWTKTVSPMIGDWLNNDTSIADISVFAEKVFHQHDFSGFKGDPGYVENKYSHIMFSKARSSIAGLYAWRAQNTTDPGEKDRMDNAADFAFRQAWALCPYSPEAVFRYVAFLTDEHRTADALLVAETAAKFPGANGASQKTIRELIAQLKRNQN